MREQRELEEAVEIWSVARSRRMTDVGGERGLGEMVCTSDPRQDSADCGDNLRQHGTTHPG